MLRLPFLLLVLLAVLSFTGNAYAANYEVIELSPIHVMIVPKPWAMDEEKGAKLTVVSYKETFKDALLTLSNRYKIKAIIPIEGFAKKEEVMVNIGGSLTIGLILEVEKK